MPHAVTTVSVAVTAPGVNGATSWPRGESGGAGGRTGRCTAARCEGGEEGKSCGCASARGSCESRSEGPRESTTGKTGRGAKTRCGRETCAEAGEETSCESTGGEAEKKGEVGLAREGFFMTPLESP